MTSSVTFLSVLIVIILRGSAGEIKDLRTQRWAVYGTPIPGGVSGVKKPPGSERERQGLLKSPGGLEE